MAYEYINGYTSPNQNARPNGAGSIKSITIHHWGARGQKFQNVVNYLCTKRFDAAGKDISTSAHYVAEAGKVACIVSPARRAWHAGSTYGNDTSIGIECRPEATEGDYETVAELVRNLRRTYGDLPLVRHSHWKPTACPGVWDLSKIDRLARQTPATEPAPTPQEDTDMPSQIKEFIRSQPQALEKGKEVYVRLSDDGSKITAVFGTRAKVFDAELALWLDGVPKGESVQVRARLVRESDGHIGKSFYMQEIIGTDGGTFGKYVCKGSVPKGWLLRYFITSHLDNVVIRQAASTAFEWNA